MQLFEKKYYVFILILLSFTSPLFAQDYDEGFQDTIQHIAISVEHAGMATGAITDVEVVPFKKIQWETSVQYDYSNGDHSIYLPITTLRFGVSHFAEVSVEYAGILHSMPPEQWKYMVQPLTVATKLRVYEGKKWIPQMSAMISLGIPSTTELAQSMHVAPSVYLLFQNDITDKFHIGYDIGLEWDGVTPQPTTLLALSLGYNFTDDYCIFAENFNYFSRNSLSNSKIDANVNVDLGFNYLIHPRVDIGAYVAINCQNPKDFTSAMIGIAWLIN